MATALNTVRSVMSQVVTAPVESPAAQGWRYITSVSHRVKPSP